jgi:hypothetical protein
VLLLFAERHCCNWLLLVLGAVLVAASAAAALCLNCLSVGDS